MIRALVYALYHYYFYLVLSKTNIRPGRMLASVN